MCVCLPSVVYLSVIHNKDLLATVHLLVAMVRRFQPEMDLPPDVKVEVVVVEVSYSCQALALFFLCSRVVSDTFSAIVSHCGWL